MGSGSFCAWGKSGEDRPFLGVWTKAGTILTFLHYGSTLFQKGRNFISTNLIYAHAMPENCINYYLYSGHSVLCLDPVSFWQYPGMDIYFVPFGTFLVIFLD